jgi:hypothetical protein
MAMSSKPELRRFAGEMGIYRQEQRIARFQSSGGPYTQICFQNLLVTTLFTGIPLRLGDSLTSSILCRFKNNQAGVPPERTARLKQA